MHPRKVTSDLLKQLSPILSMSKPSTGDPSPKINLLWAWLQLTPGPPAQRWAVLLCVPGESPFGYSTPRNRGAEAFQGALGSSPLPPLQL